VTEAAAATGPVIVGTALGPGHDGRAELVVELGYPNGARTHLSVTQEALVGALDAAGVTRAEDLHGQPWTLLLGTGLLGTGLLGTGPLDRDHLSDAPQQPSR
jgi:hypothetical protein